MYIIGNQQQLLIVSGSSIVGGILDFIFKFIQGFVTDRIGIKLLFMFSSSNFFQNYYSFRLLKELS